MVRGRHLPVESALIPPVRVATPTPVVTFDDAAQWLRIIGDESEKALIEGLIASATNRLDGWSGILGRCLVTQQWRCDFPAWCRTFRLPFPDVSTATIEYSDPEDAAQTVANGKYALGNDAKGALVVLSRSFEFPAVNIDRPDPVRITMTAGYGAATDVPPEIKTAILLTVAHWYEHREAVGDGSLAELPMGVNALIAPHRRTGV
jgi:uncharacterized phiE125 gp8 family phage protein